MIPIGDSVRSRTFPYVNVAIIAINILVFLYYWQGLSDSPSGVPGIGVLSERDAFVWDWGTIPACLGDQFGFTPAVDPRALALLCPSSGDLLLTPFTAMFIHGGLLHVGFNMLFLWVFGDNVEDAMGHARYAAFYIVAGLAATAAHIAVNQNDVIPVIGASGAIAGVLAAYLVLYPRASVSVILPIFLFIWIPFQVPAILLIGLWFFMQVLNGVASLGTADVINGGGGVAWFAHLGGFVAGLLLVKLFVLGRRIPPSRPALRG